MQGRDAVTSHAENQVQHRSLVELAGRDHKFGYDFATAADALRESGFSQVRLSSFMGSEYEAPNIDAQSGWAPLEWADTSNSLFVEAVK